LDLVETLEELGVQHPVHHPVAWYLFLLAWFFLCAWAAADSVHRLKHKEGKSVLRIVCAWMSLLGCTYMAGMTLFILIVGFLGVA
jgi:hypothetical protein